MSRHTGPWLELRLHDRRTRSITVEDGRTEAARAVRHCGVGVRAFFDGAWGFASTSVLTLPAIERAIAQATAAATAAAKGKKRGGKKLTQPAAVPWQNGTYVSPGLEPLHSRSLADKIDLVMQTAVAARKAGARITSASATYSEIVDEKFIVTADGARIHILDDKPELRVNVVAGRDGELQSCTEASGKTGGFGDLFMRRTAQQMADKAAQTATDLLSAPGVEGGRQKVILAPDVVGLLVHEAIGHTVEADFVLAGSAAAGKLGHKVASDLVTLCDSGHSEYEAGAGGIVLVDDEGVPARKVTIIERGVLKSYLHNRETAEHFGVEPTGNARAFEYDNEPLIRMRNTYIEPGITPLPAMIEGVDDGWLLAGAKNGQADANAEFMFVVGEAYPIKNGKLGPLHKGTTITGDAFDVLRSVDAVGDAFCWDLGSGYCGKGQPAKVDAGGPHIRCTATLASGSKA
ncbi:MAG TPA: TldD/PmbA family protein [Myxococcota bacterium]